jgi:ribosome-associated toxin RatA of RatAB toxin-antitoxin module
MATINNEILIITSADAIWDILSDPELLEKYDPTVKKSVLISGQRKGIGAGRRVDMRDGKNWFEEKITVHEPMQALTYELTACSFPIHRLQHSYSFEKTGSQIKVKQLMKYTVKFGILGKLLDWLIIRRDSDKGIKQFLAGLKTYVEKHRV